MILHGKIKDWLAFTQQEIEMIPNVAKRLTTHLNYTAEKAYELGLFCAKIPENMQKLNNFITFQSGNVSEIIKFLETLDNYVLLCCIAKQGILRWFETLTVDQKAQYTYDSNNNPTYLGSDADFNSKLENKRFADLITQLKCYTEVIVKNY